REASQLLETKGTETIPQALLYQGFSHMTRWQYSKAITYLRRYISAKPIDPYQKLIAKVNLCASYVFVGKHSSAQALLEKVLRTTERKNLSLLKGNSHELLAQVFFNQKKYPEARKQLELSYQSLKHSKTIGHFFVKKWRVLLELKTHKNPKDILPSLHALRREATKMKHWESVRDCDFYFLDITEDPQLFDYLYFGTPYQDFRKRLHAAHPNHPSISPSYIWHPGQPKQKGSEYLDLKAGVDFGRHLDIKPAQLHHRLLMTLSQDFYRTFGVGNLFSFLYENEFYNPITSPERVYKAIQRFRSWAESSSTPLDIQENLGQYRLRTTGAYGILVEPNTRIYTQIEVQRHRLKHEWRNQAFTTRQAGLTLNLSASAVRELLKNLTRQGLLLTYGQGPRQKHTFSRATLVRLQSQKI
ncbi:MAG: hypothetical protein KDD43_14065, partial [Bdellovibrionales bacterium]|nr:hypothetical protein [Bdellovibrionales bacterium]